MVFDNKEDFKEFKSVGQDLDRFITFKKMVNLGISFGPRDLTKYDIDVFSIIQDKIFEIEAKKCQQKT